MVMIEIKVGTSSLSAQQLNTLTAKQPENNEVQSCNLYKDTVRPLYHVENPQGMSPMSSYKQHFDVAHSLTDPIDPKPTLHAEHIQVDSIVRK